MYIFVIIWKNSSKKTQKLHEITIFPFAKKRKKKINHTNTVKHVYSEVPGMGNFAWL